ncbi:Crotonobetainyl-CoA:carnitine CoA-transferase CaiB [Microbacterium pygmaeum]|uniref:Crotonobetainyl-CoA:carnitine CoA-transferase CaiB n=2 Tax=Microbacterium pygmaeum TaxID=370764 RepID=A0A1G7XEG3_9MICO|nr:Crotonobetainyl-CoA:carnitine CoA-transferase CaiB [Microbacterium pygmaeum]
MHRGPLSGLRVVDLTTSYAGPTASMYLADLGADVIKVERPLVGDDARTWGPPFIDGQSPWFASANRNKRSLVLDLRTDDGLTALRELIATADVFMQNLNPTKLKRLGVDPGRMRAENPRLIYCAMSGFGLSGPSNMLPGYDLAAQARSGLMSVTGSMGGSPQRVSTALSDIVTGMCAALAISAAVVRQRGEGAGEVIDVSLLDSDLALMAPRIASYLAGEAEPAPSGGTDSVLAVYQSFPTADRDIIIAIGNDAMWVRFCTALGLDDLAVDARLSTNAGRREHRLRIIAAVTERLSTQKSATWLACLNAANVPVSCVQSLSEVVADEQVIARGAILPVPDAEGLFTVHSPFRFASITQPRNDGVAALGEHTREVLEEIGLAADRVDRLVAAGDPAAAAPEPAAAPSHG